MAGVHSLWPWVDSLSKYLNQTGGPAEGGSLLGECALEPASVPASIPLLAIHTMVGMQGVVG